MDAVGVEPEPLDDPLPDPLADHDHLVRPSCGAVVGEPAEQALAAREELRQIEVLHVEERQDPASPSTRGTGTVSG